MAHQTYTNLAQSTLASNYTAGDTSVFVQAGDGAKFPSAGDFIIAIDDPPAFFLKCTSRSTDTLTVASTGQETTTAASKSSGTKVTQVITAGVLDNIRVDMSSSGAYASLPVSGMKSGDVYQCTDCIYRFIYSGSAWVPYVLGFQCTLPPSASWTWDTQGSSTVDTSTGNMYLTFAAVGSDALRAYYRTAAGTFTMVMMCQIATWKQTNPQCGIGIILGDGTKYMNMAPFDYTGQSVTARWSCLPWTTRTAPGSAVGTFISAAVNSVIGGAYCWMKCQLDSTNITFSVSLDGVHWTQVLQEAKGTHLSTITRVGVGGYNNTAADINILSLTGI